MVSKKIKYIETDYIIGIKGGKMIHQKFSDIEVVIHFVNEEGEPMPFGIPAYDFEIEFAVAKDVRGKQLLAKETFAQKNGVYQCTDNIRGQVEDDGLLHLYLDTKDFVKGYLYRFACLHIPDASFPDGINHVVDKKCLGLI